MAKIEELRNLKYALAEYNHRPDQNPYLVFKNPACDQELEEAGIWLADDFREYLAQRLEARQLHCEIFSPTLMEGNLLWCISSNRRGYGDVQYPVGTVIGRTTSRDIEIIVPLNAVLVFPDRIYPEINKREKVAALLDEYSMPFRELNWVLGRKDYLLPSNLSNNSGRS